MTGAAPAACPFGACDGDGWLVDEATNTATPCRCRAQRVGAKRARTLSGVIPRRFCGVAFDRPPVTEISPAVVQVVRRYVRTLEANLDAGRGLLLMGNVGTGKTTLAMLVSRHALEAGRSVAIYSVPRLLAEIRTTYDQGAERSYVDLLERLAAVDLLHLDDLGAERTSEWVLEQLYSIINARYEDGRSVVVTTNVRSDDLREQIGARTVSRLAEMCEDVMLFGEDRRMELRSAS